jgi:hypothetical protein
MTSMDKTSDSLASQTRREALKTFGRYAAVAPTAMVLLQPREGHARVRASDGAKAASGRAATAITDPLRFA